MAAFYLRDFIKLSPTEMNNLENISWIITNKLKLQTDVRIIHFIIWAP